MRTMIPPRAPTARGAARTLASERADGVVEAPPEVGLGAEERGEHATWSADRLGAPDIRNSRSAEAQETWPNRPTLEPRKTSDNMDYGN